MFIVWIILMRLSIIDCTIDIFMTFFESIMFYQEITNKMKYVKWIISSGPEQSLIPVIFLDQEGIGNIGVRKFML